MQKLDNIQRLDLRQQLVITPLMHQALKILQMTSMELMDYLKDELEENPVIDDEIIEEDRIVTDKKQDEIATEVGDPEQEWERIFESSGWNDTYVRSEREDKDIVFFEQALTKSESLSEHLMWQLRIATDDPVEFKAGEAIISAIDDDGYFRGDYEPLAKSIGVKIEKLIEIHELIKTFEPVGVGASNLRECLLIQLKNIGEVDSWAYRIVENHLSDLEKNRLPRIATALKIRMDALKEAINKISKLEPRPGRQFLSQEITYVIPDVSVQILDGELMVMVNSEWIPNLNINNKYVNMLKSKNISKELKGYLKEKLGRSLWLIKTIHQRNTTIYKVTESIFKMQKDFLVDGVRALKPLTLRQIAEDIEMHPSTVSRVTANKYVQTTKGVFLLKYFFSSSIHTDEGIDASSKSIKAVIKDIIARESVKHPFSDQKIVNILKRHGFNLARRTVTKYREQLQILPSHKRKVYE
ncbi:MAG: RNA polymerase factor sigma-54 [Candidatus Hydrogenedentota bacterium]